MIYTTMKEGEKMENKNIFEKIKDVEKLEIFHQNNFLNYEKIKNDVLTALRENNVTANTSKELLEHFSNLYQLEFLHMR